MGRTVKYFISVICGQIVHSLVDVFVKTKHPLQVQCIDAVSLFVLGHFLPILIVHLYISNK